MPRKWIHSHRFEQIKTEFVMKAFEIRDSFGVNSLKVVERPDPSAGPGQVLLKMKAFSVNYRDLLVVDGVGRWKPPLGRVPVSDGVGIVAAAGSGVSRVNVGDRVAPIFYPKWLEGRVAGGKMGQALGGAAADGVLAACVTTVRAHHCVVSFANCGPLNICSLSSACARSHSAGAVPPRVGRRSCSL